MLAKLRAVAALSVLFAWSASAQFQTGFESPDYLGSPEGVIVTGQGGWYRPSGIDARVYTYNANALGLPPNPSGGEQFLAGVSQGGPNQAARAQRDFDFSSSDTWVFAYDIAVTYSGQLPAQPNLTSFILPPAPNTRSFVGLNNFEDPNNPTTWKAEYSVADADGNVIDAISAGPAWAGLEVNHWYRLTTHINFQTSRITRVSITDLHTGSTTHAEPDWYLFGGPDSNLPLPTSARFFVGGSVGGTGAYDNFSLDHGGPHITDLFMQGQVNGEPFNVQGVCTYDSSAFPTRVTNDLTYSNIPQGYAAPIVITIINTWRCDKDKEDKKDTSKNLDQVSGGEFSFSRDISVQDAQGNHLGSFTVSGDLVKDSEQHSTASASMQGNYFGPTDIVSVSGYKQLMQQDGSGVIRGSYTQTLTLSSGELLTLTANTTWTYDGDDTLDQDQYSFLNIDTLTFDAPTGRLFLSGQGLYTQSQKFHVTSLTMDGLVNGDAFTAKGVCTYDGDQFPTAVTNDLTYSNVPQGFSVPIVITIINTWRCDKKDDAKNLDQATGGEFSFSRDITVTDDQGLPLGSFTVTGHLVKDSDDHSTATASLEGSYNGPTDIVSVSGYKQLMQQAGPGAIHGSYTQTLTRSNGQTLHLAASTTWTYEGDGALDQDQYSVLNVDSLSFLPSTGRLLLAGAGFYTQSPAFHVTELSMDALVNGQAFDVSGACTYDNAGFPTAVTNELNYSDVPSGYSPFIVITIINTWRCKPKDDAKNLDQISGGEFSFSRDITVEDDQGAPLGSFTVTGHLDRESDDHSTAVASLQGNYNGPTDIVAVSGYEQLMQQAGPGVVNGSYTQTLTRANGEPLHLTANTTWTYDGGGALDQDQYSVLDIDALTFDPASGDLFLGGAGFYTQSLACYPDFDGSGDLDLFDFLGYVNAFNQNDPSADCDASGSFDLFDFLCFVNAFNQGC